MRNRLSLIPLFLAMFAIFAGVPAAAQADYRDVYTDCSDGTIDGTFTAKELQQALQNVDAFAGDYSECSDAIFRAQQALAGGQKKSTPKPTGGTGAAGGTTGTGAPAGTAAAPSTAGTTPTQTATTPDRQNDARDADAAEKAAALAAATASADRKAGQEAAELKNTGVPAAALQVGGSDTTLPGPLLLTLIACVLAACIAGGTTGFQALRRRRGR